MTVVSEPRFSARLRSATHHDHHAAESADYVRSLLAGQLTRDQYAALVAQHWFIYQALEQAAEVIRTDPVAGGFVDDRLHRLPALASDLDLLLGAGWRERITPSPATAAYQARLREVCFTWPAGFIAHHYTRYLGDLSGGQAIRAAVVDAYHLTGGQGAEFYDFRDLGPVAAFKTAYRARLDTLPYPEPELDRLVDEVRLAYQLNTAVFDDLAGAANPSDLPSATPQSTPSDPFPPPVVEQVMRHMNEDHAADSLQIVRGLGGRPGATAARMTGMDADGIAFAATVDGTELPVRIPFAHRLTQRAEIRKEVVRMHKQACAALGEPRASSD